MTKSSVVSINESLEQIEELTADIRLALMQRDQSIILEYLWDILMSAGGAELRCLKQTI